ncbi:serine/threonine-protein phosphatase 6 regulatory ankyrin repeat subunit C-like isoform X2 [Penaeus chinensis]|uniref:serine/threonine-protein phosphatase 6 regulatory ankyrin repeat subunit C-like isoform X2 n=1 Tax=Penaeus chinensis TaxID=139456 RepID=UPI001FB830C6|nr:serine/threonine-protein phosphatase 6 regulatory ankyrin repeat subunit C-like isoform X2 [Penaeus chinensis]
MSKEVQRVRQEEVRPSVPLADPVDSKKVLDESISRDRQGRTPLHYAADQGFAENTRKWLKRGLNANLSDVYGSTPLHLAADKGHRECAKILLQNGAQVDSQNDHGQTPLLKASLNDDLPIVKLLLNHGADPNIPDSTGGTPLHVAAKENYVDVLLYLLRRRGKPNITTKMGCTPLHMAAMMGHLHAVQLLIQHKAQVNIVDQKGQTPLLQAVLEDHYFIVERLLRGGANPDIAERSGDTPLHAAAEREFKIIFHLLINGDADPRICNNKGRTPLHTAAKVGFASAVKAITRCGADLNVFDNKGWSSLHLAAWKGHAKVAEYLKSSGASIDIKNKEGWTPLHMACMLGHVKTVDILAKEANVNSQNEKGCTPLDFAYLYSHFPVIKKLEALGARRNTPDFGARGPWKKIETQAIGVFGILDAVRWLTHHYKHDDKENDVKFLLAALEGDIKVVKEMIQDDVCDVNVTGKNGITALHCAAFSGKMAVISELLNAGADLQALTEQGVSVLHCACLTGRIITAQMLVQHHNADKETCDRAGFSPEDYAKLRGHHHIVSCIYKTSNDSNQRRPVQEYMAISKELYRSVLEVHKQIADGPLEELKLLLECGACDPNLQDKQGKTLLHLATQKGNFEIIKFLLEHGTLPTARTHIFQTARFIAELEDLKKIVSLLLSYERLNDMSTRQKCLLNTKLLGLITATRSWQDTHEERILEAVKQCTSLLLSGAPLEPLCCHSVSAINLAISTNCTPLIPLLLATGNSLTSAANSVSLLQLAWSSEDITPWVGVVITETIVNQLNTEINYVSSEALDNILKKPIEDLVVILQGDFPWKAKFPDLPLADQDLLDSLLCQACKRGATMAAWWIWQRGGTMIPLSISSVMPLHAAARAQQWHTVEALVRHMGASLFLPDNEGYTSLENIPAKLKKTLLEDSLAQEHNILSQVFIKTRETSDQRELQQLILFHHVLASEYEHKQTDKVNDSRWRVVLAWLISALTIPVDKTSWVSHLCWTLRNSLELKDDVSLSQVMQRDRNHECDYSSLTEMTACLYSYYNLYMGEKKASSLGKISDALLSDIQRRALKTCCERRLPFFLHLLVTIANVSVNDIVDPDYGLLPLHLAARKNNRSALMYLLTHNAFLSPDIFGNTFIHYAYMHGHYDIGDMISLSFYNKSGKQPDDLKSAFSTYVENYHVNTKDSNIELQKNTSSSQVIQVHLNRLQKEWEEKGFEKSVREICVDYSKGESAKIHELVTSLVGRLMAEVAAVAPIFEGELLMLGSSADNTRLYCPDEFDCNILLKNISGHPGREVQLTLETQKVDHEGCSTSIQLSSNQDNIKPLLEGSLFLTKFYNVIKRCLLKCDMGDRRLTIAYPGVKRTRVGVGLRLLWLGEEFKILHLDIDIVPTVEAPWPDQFPKPNIASPFLNNVYINSTGDGKWRFSFARAENFIMKNLTPEQQTTFLACKMIMTRLKLEEWVPKEARDEYKYFDSKFFRIPTPRGFLLKNSFFFELEMARDHSLWTKDKIKDRMKSIFKRMCTEFTHPTTGEITLEPGKVEAYFGKSTQTSECGYGAPDIYCFLDALPAL